MTDKPFDFDDLPHPTCQACRAYNPPTDGEEMGACRLHAPRLFALPVMTGKTLTGAPAISWANTSGWPAVRPDQWCLSHKPRNAEPVH